ncbi:MAG: hypothetical protein JW934_00815 [Anaerolineae bacterium]|nr:hypothetical protein [Anaerolineae bacterium]
MLSEIEQFHKWLRRKSPHASTPIHYANDLDLFFTWLDKPPDAATFQDIDCYIEHCQSAAECAPPTPRPPGFGDPPCTAGINGNGVQVICDGDDPIDGQYLNYLVDVVAQVPPHLVIRNPWPRSLVTVINTFELQPEPRYSAPGGESGNWSSAALPYSTGANGTHEGQIANYQMGLRWRRLDDQPPVWTFDERPWNVGRDYGLGAIANSAEGWSVSHYYETASSDIDNPDRYGDPDDKPCNGPGLDGRWNLPAYQVQVGTHWTIEWAQQWDVWVKVCSEARCVHSSGVWQLDLDPCNRGWAGWRREDHDIYEWQHRYDGWHIIDLTRYGSPTWYYTSYAVRSSGDGINWGSVLDVVPAPVIEVQSVIRN